MPDPRPQDRPRLTLEQLLALKRSERPAPAFWEEFDRELHRRQLASIVSRPSWYTRFTRGLVIGLRRAAPVAAAGAAAVAGFVVLQRPAAEPAAPASETTVAAGSETPAPAAASPEATPVVAALAPEVSIPDLAMLESAPPPTGAPRFVMHEFVAAATPSRAFVSVTSPNTFSSPAADASLQMVNTLTLGASRRAGVAVEAGSF